MSAHDAIVHGGLVVTPRNVKCLDIAIDGGRISAVEPAISRPARLHIPADGLYVFPGLIDVHVHFNEPGRTGWEGFASGTTALAAGGVTCFLDMPLNSHPPTVDRRSFAQKRMRARASSHVDFGFWGGMIPGKLDQLEALAEEGVAGFKAFMCSSGIEEFPPVDDETLYEGMQIAARLGLVVAVHAESETIVSTLTRNARSMGRRTARAYLDTRPLSAELEAIQRAIEIAAATGCALHIAHVSAGAAARLVAEASRRGVDVTCETCPHYLVFTQDDLETLGTLVKCAPPLRSRQDQEELWRELAHGSVHLVASDHSPAPPPAKHRKDFFEAWGGIAGCQSTLSVLLTAGYATGRLSLSQIARLTSEEPAKRFGLYPKKGAIAPGCDADLAIVDLSEQWVLRERDLFYRHPTSPYVGQRWIGRVVRTMVRGTTVYGDGRIARAAGRMVVPLRTPCRAERRANPSPASSSAAG